MSEELKIILLISILIIGVLILSIRAIFHFIELRKITKVLKYYDEKINKDL